MRRLRNLALAFGLVVSPLACSSGTAENVGTTSEAVSTGCNLEHIGEPCDPDPSTAGGECTGVCALATTSGGLATATCTKLVDAKDNDGKICGTAANKKSDCKRTCKTGFCQLAGVPGAQAAVGTACKPSDDGSGGFNSTICDGACNASGGCDFLGFGERCPRTAAACLYAFCDPLKSTTCKNLPLGKDTDCNDGNGCTENDVCDGAGKCAGSNLAAGTGTCPGDGNPCTAEACDGTGKCGSTNVAKDTACTNDFDACTVDVCDGAGKCTHPARDCDDGDLCTNDSCKSAGTGAGCVHTPKCAGDACNTGSCDATTGACSLVPIGCTDFDPCTTDTCELPGGCKHTPIPGCGDAGVDSGSDTGATDSGTTATDSGTTATDSGTTATDSGTTATDSGTTATDSGTTATDSGTTATDSGTTATDSGTTATDSGTTASDSGAPAEDSGATSDDTGAPVDDSGTTPAGDDAAAVGDTGDFSANDAPVELNSGCGCRTTASHESYGALAGFAIAGIVLARRRRRI